MVQQVPVMLLNLALGLRAGVAATPEGGLGMRPEIRVGITEGDLCGRDHRVLQAAVDYVARLGGGTVYVGPGEWVLRDSIRLASHVTLRGSGPTTVLRKAPGGTSPLAEDGDYGDVRILPRQPEVSFGGVIQLAGFALAPEEVAPGGQVALRLRWRALRVMGADYQAFLHLTPLEDRHPLAQVDAPPAGEELPTARWLPGEVLEGTLRLSIPLELPPGTYRLWLGLYAPWEGERLPVSGPHGEALGDAFLVGEVTVRPPAP